MPRSWTSSPEVHLDLAVDLDAAGGRGKRAALERALRDAIRGGRLAPGTPLPSSRTLAHDLGLARGTVVEAYAQLHAEGYLLTRAGASTVVAETPAVAPAVSSAAAAPTARVAVDLRPGVLDLAAAFPRAAWLRACRSVLHHAPDAAFDYCDPRGRPELRAALAAYLARARGVVTSPDNIVVTTGFGHGLSVLSRALASVGVRAVGMEDPCLPVHRGIVRRNGLGVAAVPVDEGGLDVDALGGLDVQAVVVTPAHQYPTGVTLHATRRTELAGWARDVGGVVVEDDYDGEFRYDRQPVGAMQGLDPDHVVYGGTTSKTLGPGIRLGWLVLPPRLVEPVVEVHRVGGATPPALEQLALAELLAAGEVDRHLRKLRAVYRRRRDVLAAALSARVPALSITGIAAGLHVLIELGDGPTEAEVEAAASARGVAVAYLGPHWHRHGPAPRRPGLVVGYSRPAAPRFKPAVTKLVGMLQEVSQ